MKEGKFSHFLDGRDESHSNWMRFVNCSRCEDEQNLVAHQFRGEIYYRTYKYVNPGEELLVWYGESYAKDLGISVCEDQVNRKKGKFFLLDRLFSSSITSNFLLDLTKTQPFHRKLSTSLSNSNTSMGIQSWSNLGGSTWDWFICRSREFSFFCRGAGRERGSWHDSGCAKEGTFVSSVRQDSPITSIV